MTSDLRMTMHPSEQLVMRWNEVLKYTEVSCQSYYFLRPTSCNGSDKLLYNHFCN